MGTKTDKITFNVRERGRRYRGQDRNFDTAALAALINGGEVQEKVKHRDMLGYFGHWPRVKFGMNPTEGAIVDGKQVALEPAIVTTYLHANPDGTIEHETEFLDTASGKLAERLFMSKAGGFSSAIDTRKCADKQVPIGFYGFDYVLEPNFTKNRGYSVLDGVTDEMMAVLDDAGEYNAMFDAVNKLYDSLQQSYDQLAAALQHKNEECEELIGMLASRNEEVKAFDSVVSDLMRGEETGRLSDAEKFLTATLIGYEKPATDSKTLDSAAEGNKVVSRMFR